MTPYNQHHQQHQSIEGGTVTRHQGSTLSTSSGFVSLGQDGRDGRTDGSSELDGDVKDCTDDSLILIESFSDGLDLAAHPGRRESQAVDDQGREGECQKLVPGTIWAKMIDETMIKIHPINMINFVRMKTNRLVTV